MKLGCCIISFSREGDPLGLWTLPLLKKAGYDYAELHITLFTQMEEAAFDQVLACVKASETPAQAGCCLFPGELSLYGEETPVLDYVEKAASRAERLGLKTLVFGSGRVRSKPEGLSEEETFYRLTQLLKKAAGIVAAHGMILVVEPLNRKETDMIQKLDQGRRLVEAVDHPAVRLLVDYYHFCQEADVLGENALPLLAHAHYAQPDKRVYPHEIDSKAAEFLGALRRGGYDGRISIEASAPDGEEDLFRAAKLLRPYIGG